MDTSFIEKIVGLDTTKLSPYDTTYTLTYGYDNLKRVVNVTYLEYSNSGAFDNLNNITEIQTNYYSNNDSLPYRSKIISTSINNEYQNEHYLSYSSNGILIYDSSVSFQTQPIQSSPQIKVNSFLTDINPRVQITNNQFNGIIDTVFINTTTQNNNIINQENNSASWGTSNLTLTYDLMINPFKKLNTWKNQYPNFLYDQSWIFSRGIVNSHRTNNNVVRAVLTNVNGSGQNFECSYIYKYNAAHYPIEMVFRNMVNGGYIRPSINKIKFIYR
jgi:hypothetical protein